MMLKHRFQLTLEKWNDIQEFPYSWPTSRLRELLGLLEFADVISDDDVSDLVTMLLEDLGPRRAAEVVLEVVFGNQMSAGVRQNIAVDLQQDEPWSQHAAVDQQAGIFAAVVLLHRTLPKFFGRPEAVRFELTVQSLKPEASEWLSDNVNAGLIVRLLAQGMGPDATLNRLYGDEIEGDWFPEAGDILWCITRLTDERFAIISSEHWVGPLKQQSSWLANASIDQMGKRQDNSGRGSLNEYSRAFA